MNGSVREIAPDQKLACGAWIEETIHRRAEYSEEYEDTLAIGEYFIRDRAIYLTGKDKVLPVPGPHPGRIERRHVRMRPFFRHDTPIWRTSASRTSPHPRRFWLRINLVRNHEARGVPGNVILEFKGWKRRLLAGNSELYMY